MTVLHRRPFHGPRHPRHDLECGYDEPLDRPPQPADGYRKMMTPTGPNVRYEDAFPESCCEGAPAPVKGD